MDSENGRKAQDVVRVYLVTRIRLFADALVRALPRGVELVGAAGALENVLAQITELQPDVVLVDGAMPGAPSVTRAIAAAAETQLVILGIGDQPGEVLAFAEAGAAGYLPREGGLHDLIRTVKGTVTGEVDVSPRVAAALIARIGELASGRPSGNVRLTTRELEVLRLIDGGMSNKQIARQLRIELATVKNHVHNILAKLEVSSRGEAARRLHDGVGARGGAPGLVLV